MAGSRTGTPTILRAARTICRMVGAYGAGDLEARTTPAFAAAVTALVSACHALEALDDHVGEIDQTAPFGPEDVEPL